MTAAYLYTATRTPFGRYAGGLAGIRPDDLAAHVVGEVVAAAPALDPAQLDEVILGNANGAGEENRNVARMAALLAGFPTSVPGSTVNRLCGSGLDAIMLASRAIETGDASIIVAGGVESMSRAPWVVRKPERAYPSGDGELVSSTLGWRLVNERMPATWTVSLGEANEQLRDRFEITREDQDAFAVASHHNAQRAWDDGFYDSLVTPVPGSDLVRDENIRGDASVETLAGLRTVFRKNGTITAGNASPLTDGAAAVLVGSEAAAATLGVAPIARIAGRGMFANDPQDFGIAPIEAAERALRAAGIGWADVGAVELNEAFAVQSLACIRAWDVDPQLVNARGGAIALGHPLGASGARLAGTLANRLIEGNHRFGVAAICIGVGQSLAIVLENVAVLENVTVLDNVTNSESSTDTKGSDR